MKTRRAARREARDLAAEWYELFSLLMRYVFAALGAVIVWRVYRWIRRDAKQYNREMRRLPDAGLVGEMVDLDTGESYPLPREGMIGSARGCDIRVKHKDVYGRHATFAFEEGRGLRVAPYHRHPLSMDGTELLGAAHALHGSVVSLGRRALRVRLFAGLNVPHPSAYMRDEHAVYPEDAPAYRTPSPFDDAPDQSPAPLYSSSDARAQMQNTWSYAVPPPQAQDAPPFFPAGRTDTCAPPDAPYARDIPGAPTAYPIPPEADAPDENEAPVYQSPMPARHRRRDRR